MKRDRRNFLKTAAVGSAGLLLSKSVLGFSPKSYSRIIGANDRVNVGMIGTNSRGLYLLGVYAEIKNANVIGICDVDSNVIAKTSKRLTDLTGNVAVTEKDIHKFLTNKDIDAVTIATPDHWHTPAAIMALTAGKHVYVEKPCSHNPQEGEWLVEAQLKYNKIVQMGNQQRSSIESRDIMSQIHNGLIGETYKAYCWYINTRKPLGKGTVISAPNNLDWDLWQGPAPRHPLKSNYVPYNWHWFWNWGTAETGNNATHELDIARWALQVDYPVVVKSDGSRAFMNGDDWEVYDTLNASFIYEHDKSIVWDGESCNGMMKFGRDRGTVVYGTKGSAIIDRNGYEVYDLGGKKITEVKSSQVNATTNTVGGGGLEKLHITNFLDTIRGVATSQNSPIVEGHKSTLMCNLANIAYRVNHEIHCNPTNGHIQETDASKMWQRTYEKGWEIKF